MRKLVILCVSAFMAIITISAQDIIVTKDAKKIEAKILEVSKSEIKYKEKDYLDGPTFILETEDISSIIYANGKVVLYNQQEVNSPNEKDDVNSAVKKKAEALIGGFAFSNTEDVLSEGTKGKGRPSLDELNCWRLEGRGLVGALPRPVSTINQEGRVVVQIRVNAAGDVIDANIIKGTTITDKQTLQHVLDAAKKAKFTSDDHDQIGTIIYNLKFN